MFGDFKYFPRIEPGVYSALGDSYAGGTDAAITTFQPTITKFWGNHSVRAGYDYRLYTRGRRTRATTWPGAYRFNQGFTNGGTGLPNAPIGQDLASLLLGLPASTSQIEIAPTRDNRSLYQGVFVQDDWKINDKLTVNLGLRYEHEGAPTDANNANVRGFDPTATLNVTAAARARYALNPIAELPASQFNPVGGVNFASDSTPGFWNTDTNNWQPRLGFAYQLNSHDRAARRLGHLHGADAVRLRDLPAGLLAEHARRRRPTTTASRTRPTSPTPGRAAPSSRRATRRA